jgi:hypothetical protein
VNGWRQCVASSPASETAIILGVGDLTHSDDQTNADAQRSKHVSLTLTPGISARYDVTIAAMAAAIETAQPTKHKRIIVRILPGNHDPHDVYGGAFRAGGAIP